MKQTVFHKFDNIIITHWNNDLFFGGAFSGHLNSQFGFQGAIDNFMNLMLARVVLSDALLLWLGVGMILGVSLAKIFFLRDLVFFSALRESHLD